MEDEFEAKEGRKTIQQDIIKRREYLFYSVSVIISGG